jgi:monovalent cation:H+ antiporter-2, CPA2 family
MTPHDAHDSARLFVEIGAAIIVLALLARLANRLGFSAIPLYLLLGLALGNGGLLPLKLSQNSIGTGGEVGVLLLLFMLGLECSGEELVNNLRFGCRQGARTFC